MKSNLRELLASLPEDDNVPNILDSEAAREQLQAIFADLAYRPVPVHSLHRLWTLGELSTQVALAYTAVWLRGWFVDAESRQRQMLETNLRVALKIIHRLGYLRGAATKLGQMFGNLPEVLPDQIVSTLDTLHSEAPPMHFSLLREMVRNELGGDPSELFASFEKEPFAAASIGQVHRATLKSGEAVAVKIQYPGIGRAIDADVRNLMALIFPLRLSRGWESLKGYCLAIQQMLAQEADYLHEAQNMLEVQKLFTPEDGVVVPRVFERFSSSRILTTEFIPGPQLKEFLASDPPQPLRDAYGTIIWRAYLRMCFAFLNYGDPHPGNLIFMADGRLGILDFGCIQRFSAEERAHYLRTDAFIDDPSTLPDLLLEARFATQSDLANPDYMTMLRSLWDWCVEPVRHRGEFDFGDEKFFKRGVELTRDCVAKRYSAAAPMYVYLSRSSFGMAALLLRLRARFDARTVHRQEMATRHSRGE